MYTFTGRYVYLEQLTTKNDKQLFDLMKENEKEYQYYVSDQPLPDSYEEFLDILQDCFKYGRSYQFLVYRKSDKKIIGTIFFYYWDEKNNSVKISAFFIPEARKTLLTMEALGAGFLFALDVMKIEELKFDCYRENKEMLELAKKIGAVEIGESKSEVNPERDLVNFRLPKESLILLREKMTKFEQRKRVR